MRKDIVLVTGGAGFIGSHFVRKLLARPEPPDVVVFEKLTYAANLKNLSGLSYDLICGDLADKDDVRKLLDFNFSHIVHLAAESHVDRSIEGPEVFVRSNLQGTFNLLELALEKKKHIKKFLHVSTDEVYGELGPVGQFTESTRYAPNSP